jgi:hypothetical protein
MMEPCMFLHATWDAMTCRIMLSMRMVSMYAKPCDHYPAAGRTTGATAANTLPDRLCLFLGPLWLQHHVLSEQLLAAAWSTALLSPPPVCCLRGIEYIACCCSNICCRSLSPS